MRPKYQCNIRANDRANDQGGMRARVLGMRARVLFMFAQHLTDQLRVPRMVVRAAKDGGGYQGNWLEYREPGNLKPLHMSLRS